MGQTLQEVQASLKAFTSSGWASEIIVCDNNSTDRTAEIARAAGATAVFEPVNQIARARNCGAAAATGDWLLFIDADSHPSAELFADVLKAIESNQYLAGGATIRMADGFPLANFVTRSWNWLSRWRRMLAGSFIFCEAQAFRKIGGFSNELFAAEELDLTVRLKQLGRETGKQIVILHRHPLVTSARKLKLYSARELLWFFLRAAFRQKATLSSRAACHPWYDGRR